MLNLKAQRVIIFDSGQAIDRNAINEENYMDFSNYSHVASNIFFYISLLLFNNVNNLYLRLIIYILSRNVIKFKVKVCNCNLISFLHDYFNYT